MNISNILFIAGGANFIVAKVIDNKRIRLSRKRDKESSPAGELHCHHPLNFIVVVDQTRRSSPRSSLMSAKSAPAKKASKKRQVIYIHCCKIFILCVLLVAAQYDNP